MSLELTDVSSEDYRPDFGAREPRCLIRTLVEARLWEEIPKGETGTGDTVAADWPEAAVEVTVEVEKPAEDQAEAWAPEDIDETGATDPGAEETVSE